MRNIKFRLWDSINNKWLLGYEYPNLGGFSMMGEVMAFGEYSGVLSQYDILDWNKLILMQYTGLKDNNGKEIYEGDVIQTEITIKNYDDDEICNPRNHNIPQFESKRITKVIEWNYAILANLPKDKTVIGNIYENPELITK